MKTIEELIKEISVSKELQEEFQAVKDMETAEAFLKKNECEATVEEFWSKLSEGELSDEAAEIISGGCWSPTYRSPQAIPPKPAHYL